MITLLDSYVELLAKLDKDEQIKYITKAMPLIKKESPVYEDKYITTIKTLSKLRKIKSKILADDATHIYSILELDSEDEDTANELKQPFVYIISTMSHEYVIKYIKSQFKNMLGDKIKYLEHAIRSNLKKQYKLKNPVLHEYCIINSKEEFNQQKIKNS